MKKVLIVEDNVDSAKMLEKLVKEVDNTAVCYLTANPNEVYEIVFNNEIDLFLMDIILNTENLGDVSGIELAEKIRSVDRYKFTPIVFISSLTDPKMYAYSALHSYKYIEKPFPVEETRNTIKEALQYKKGNESNKYHYFRRDGILLAFREDEIVYLESKFHQIHLCTIKEKITIPYKTCNDMLEILNNENFAQCNRGTIVNRRYIENVDITRRYIKLRDNYGSLSIGAKYIKQVVDGREI